MSKIDPIWFANWKGTIIKEIEKHKKYGSKIEYTLRLSQTASFLISQLSIAKIPFKVANLGAGVKRITTDTESCPFCKKKL